MADQFSQGSEDKKDSSGLRSTPLGVLPSDRKKKDTLSLVLVGVGIAVLVLALVGIGFYSGWWKSNKQTADKGGLFQQLPNSGEQTVHNTASGLSGMTCDHPTRRPIGVMLAGDPINRPISGFSQADMVFELPVLTNDVTRLTGIFQCQEPKEIGSVRSVRHDYLFLITGIDGIMAHWGGSYHALNRIAAGEFQTINALVNPFDSFYRKDNLPAPYNGFTSYDRLWNALQKLGYRTETVFKGYDFKDDAPADQRPAGGALSIAWPGAFRVSYQYDPTTNRYVRYWADVKQTDPANNNAVVDPSAVVVMRATDGPMEGPGGYNDVGIEGKGALEVYQDGQLIKGTWTKNELDKKDPIHFTNEQGQPIVFTRGQLWITAVEPTIGVTWTPKAGTTSPTTTPTK